jgi:hypothetical protein
LGVPLFQFAEDQKKQHWLRHDKKFLEKNKKYLFGQVTNKKKRKEGKTTTRAGHLAQRNGDVETDCGEPRPRHLSPPPFRVYIEGGLNRRRCAKHVSFSLWIEKRYLVFTSFEILRDRDWPL